jgi:dihydroxyacetone kinase
MHKKPSRPTVPFKGVYEYMLVAGVLVLVINYTGDRINFGLAVEKARREGLKVSARTHSTYERASAFLNVYIFFCSFFCA